MKNTAFTITLLINISIGIIIGILTLAPHALANDQKTHLKAWNELETDPQYSTGQSFRFYRFKTNNGSQAALIIFDLKDRNYILKPFFSQQSTRTSTIAENNKALVAINGGYFNLSNGESTSYVVIDGKNQCEPKNNQALISNPELHPYMEVILNRSEFRILQDEKGHYKCAIVPHNTPIPPKYTLIHSIQAGPRLLPTVTDSEEAFVRKSNDGKIIDAIGSYKQAARTAIGITPDNHIIFLCVANKGQEEFSSGVTLAELSDMLRDLGCTQALNLDGGTSTTMIIAEGDFRNDHTYHAVPIISSKQEKLVKSGLMILKR